MLSFWKYLKIILNKWEGKENFFPFSPSLHGIVAIDDTLYFRIFDWFIFFHVVVRLSYPGLESHRGIKFADVRGDFPPVNNKLGVYSYKYTSTSFKYHLMTL